MDFSNYQGKYGKSWNVWIFRRKLQIEKSLFRLRGCLYDSEYSLFAYARLALFSYVDSYYYYSYYNYYFYNYRYYFYLW